MTEGRRLSLAAAALALALSACAGADDSATVQVTPADDAVELAEPSVLDQPDESQPEDDSSAAAATGGSLANRETTGGALALPAIEVVDLISGDSLDLSTFSPPGATLVWFWAPH